MQSFDPHDERRDYSLEARDDAASFDLMNDIDRYFVAQMRIEQAWDDRPARVNLFREYGIRSVQHYHQVKATVNRFIYSPWAAQKWGPVDAIMQRQMNATMQYQRSLMTQRANDMAGGALAPVAGVSLQVWAQGQARLMRGETPEQIAQSIGVSKAAWDQASAEWMTRMSSDTTLTVATEYGKAFSGAGQGQFGGAAQNAVAAMNGGGNPGDYGSGGAPISLEQWVEIGEAQSAAAARGEDPTAVFAHFGMDVLGWSNASMWWSEHFSKNAMLNGQELYHRYTQLQAHFKAKYGRA